MRRLALYIPVLCFGLPAPALADFIAVEQFGQGTVVRINESTGERQVIGLTGIGGVQNLARDPSGVLYTLGPELPGTQRSLYTIDAVTGVATELVPLSGPLRLSAALAFSADTGLLYAVARDAVTLVHTLFTIDPRTGVTAAVGPLGLRGLLTFNVTALDFSPEGILYGHTGSPTGTLYPGPGLFTVDTTTGEATVVTSIGLPPLWVQTIAFAPDGTLWAAGLVFAKMDRNTGQVIGPELSTLRFMSGMAFLDEAPPPPPEEEPPPADEAPPPPAEEEPPPADEAPPPPAVTCSISSPLLWPPNDRLAPVGFSAGVSVPPGVDATPLIQVFADDDAQVGDAVDVAPETLRLRAVRQGHAGRVYLIVAWVTDALDRSAFEVCSVAVPHNRSGRAIRRVLARAAAIETYYRAAQEAPPGFALIGEGPDR